MSDSYQQLLDSTFEELILSQPDRTKFQAIISSLDSQILQLKQEPPQPTYPFGNQTKRLESFSQRIEMQTQLPPKSRKLFEDTQQDSLFQKSKHNDQTSHKQYSYNTLQQNLPTKNNFPPVISNQGNDFQTSNQLPSSILDPLNFQTFQGEKQKRGQYEAYSTGFQEQLFQKEGRSKYDFRPGFTEQYTPKEELDVLQKFGQFQRQTHGQPDRKHISTLRSKSPKRDHLAEARELRQEHENNLQRILGNRF